MKIMTAAHSWGQRYMRLALFAFITALALMLAGALNPAGRSESRHGEIDRQLSSIDDSLKFDKLDFGEKIELLRISGGELTIL